MQAVLGVYARETGEGMVVSEGDGDPTPPDGSTPPEPPQKTTAESRRAKLTIVK